MTEDVKKLLIQSNYVRKEITNIKEINKSLAQFKRIKELIITTEELEKTTTKKVKRFKEMEKILS